MRIYNNRGETRQSPIDKKLRVYVRARMYPGLSISRSLGDILAHHIGVTSYPSVVCYPITMNDSFIVLATDGIWHILGQDEVVEIMNENRMAVPG